MHPAKSVILFTTASGAGYGLLVWLALFAAAGALPASRGLALVACALVLGLVVVGLLASTLHLGHPERAWRALSQWRSSWLSREGLAAVVTFVPASLFALGACGWGFDHVAVIAVGLLAAVGAVATVGCTAMIYASLKAVPAWASGWTLVGYLIFSAMTGSFLLHALMRVWDGQNAMVAGWAGFGLAVVGLAVKLAYWHRIDTAAPVSTAETATGLGAFGKVRLLEAPHSAPNYLMREMGFEIGRRHAGALRRVAVILGFFVPAGLSMIAGVVGGAPALGAALVAVVSAAVGIAVERWLFFAEARHVVTLYYGKSVA